VTLTPWLADTISLIPLALAVAETRSSSTGPRRAAGFALMSAGALGVALLALGHDRPVVGTLFAVTTVAYWVTAIRAASDAPERPEHTSH
jgi:CHASE2 domain-containing sensor protein